MLVEGEDGPVLGEGDAAGGEDGDGGPRHVESGAVGVKVGERLGVATFVQSKARDRLASRLADCSVEDSVLNETFFWVEIFVVVGPDHRVIVDHDAVLL